MEIIDVNDIFYLTYAIRLLKDAEYKWELATRHIEMCKQSQQDYNPYELSDKKIIDRYFELKEDIKRLEKWLERIKQNAAT